MVSNKWWEWKLLRRLHALTLERSNVAFWRGFNFFLLWIHLLSLVSLFPFWILHRCFALQLCLSRSLSMCPWFARVFWSLWCRVKVDTTTLRVSRSLVDDPPRGPFQRKLWLFRIVSDSTPPTLKTVVRKVCFLRYYARIPGLSSLPTSGHAALHWWFAMKASGSAMLMMAMNEILASRRPPTKKSGRWWIHRRWAPAISRVIWPQLAI